MASRNVIEERVRQRIADIAQGRRSVRLSDIEWVMGQLPALGHAVTKRGTNQHFAYVVGNLAPFNVCDHHRGQSQLKIGYVNDFLARMNELGLYKDED